MKFLLGEKLEMSQIFKGDKVVPVTLIEVVSQVVTQVKTEEKDGYKAVQLGFKKKNKNIKKTEKGKEYRCLREFRMNDLSEIELGKQIDPTVFEEADTVEVSGVTKGKGFQGGVKRWGFRGRNATHGMKHDHRKIGSIGDMGSSRVFKGKKMPGRMGNNKVTIKNLKVEKIDSENNILALRGAIPGRRGTVVEIRK